MKRVIVAAAAILSSACIAPISVSHYQTAEPVERGQMQISGGMHVVAKDARYGLDENQADGASVSTHMRGSVFVPDVQVGYGVTNNLDVHLQAFPYGGEAGARIVVLNADRVKLAAGGAFGAFSGSRNKRVEDDANGNGQIDPNEFDETRRSYGGYYADFPVTLSLIPVKALAVNVGPVLTWVQGRKTLIHWTDGVVTEEYTVRHKAWELGFFTGLAIGNEQVRLSPGVTFYLETTNYPIEHFSGNGWYGMPWIGLTIQPGMRRRAAPLPASEPAPQSQ